MDLFLKDIKRIPMLFTGYIVLAFGIYLTKLSLLGLSSWGVFHDGISNVAHLPFGVVTQLLGLTILVVSMSLLKTKVGIGTLFNIVFVGWFIDIFDLMYHTMPHHLVLQFVVLILGVLLTTLGRSLYIASKLGPGPRDGLFVGLSRITKIQVRYVKITIELIVLGIGIFLGGKAGIGTVIIIIVSGYVVQFYFKIFHFDPHSRKQSNILEYGFQNNPNFGLILGISSLICWIVPILGIIVVTYGFIYGSRKNQKYKIISFVFSFIGLICSIGYFLQTETSIDILSLII